MGNSLGPQSTLFKRQEVAKPLLPSVAASILKIVVKDRGEIHEPTERDCLQVRQQAGGFYSSHKPTTTTPLFLLKMCDPSSPLGTNRRRIDLKS
jgi:hypothetical protein